MTGPHAHAPANALPPERRTPLRMLHERRALPRPTPRGALARLRAALRSLHHPPVACRTCP